MCFEHDSRPPIRPISGAAVDGQRIALVSEDGTQVMAFEARASTASGAGAVILPDVRGLHRYYEELALRFAEAGVDAVAIDYFGRTTKSTDRGADFDFMAHVGETAYPSLLDDVAAGVHRLQSHAGGGRVRAAFSVGFCFGGRLAFLSATRRELDLAGVIGFYGTLAGPSRAGMPAPLDGTSEMRGAILGLFGGADKSIPPDSVAAFDRALSAAGVEHELVSYPGAPHSFFDRKAEQFADASDDAWQRLLEFIRRHTPPAS